MTARERLVVVQRMLVTMLIVRAAIAGVAIAIAGAAIASLVGLPAVVAGVAALVVMVLLLPPVRDARSLERVALWVEEHHPAMRYAVVTAAGSIGADAAVESQALSFPWWEDARRRIGRVLVAPAIALALSLLLVTALSRLHLGVAALRARAGTAATRAPNATVDVLAHLHATVVPPAYAGRATSTVDDPTSIEALVASTVTITGNGDASGVAASVDSAARPVSPRGDGWSVTVPMPSRPALLHLRGRGARERLVVLAPIVDAPPVVTLLLPARDSVVRAATGRWPLRAQLRDDIGLRDADFEIVISSGQDENFTFRSTTLGRVALNGAAERVLEARLDLDSLALKPGDVLQLRAVARDANHATGPGVGSSETRSLRVARAGEYDSVAVDAAPPGEPEGEVLSERMLITLTEGLEKRRRRLDRPVLLDESRRIAADQAKLRKRVGDVVFQRTGGQPLSEEVNGDPVTGKLTPDELLKRAEAATGSAAGSVMDVEGDETPILAINKPLLEAFNAMWDAGRALEQGETRQALPPMRRALAAIERARQAERIYLRGRPSNVVVDVAKVRLAGKEKGTTSIREPRLPIDPVMRRREAGFAHATTLLATDPIAAADTLLVMRVEALGDAPALAAALDAAARALRRGESSAIPLAWMSIRRALGGRPSLHDGLSPWQGGGAP